MTDTENYLRVLDYSVLQRCMHCGMCLPTCPTYDETQRERNSPRGRIALMRSVADGDLKFGPEFAQEMYYCLGCLACETACPAGVDYVEMFETARAEIERQDVFKSKPRQFYRWLTLRILFMRPRLLHALGTALWFLQCSGVQKLARKLGLTYLLPPVLRRLEPKAPTIKKPFSCGRISEMEKPANVRYRVGLLTGCVQDLIYPEVNRATADVLLHNDCEVLTPRNQFCCGSLHAHNGDLESARELTRRNLDMFPVDQLDAIITNAGGCGSQLKKYGHLLAEDNHYASRAREWDQKVKDIHEWLVEIEAVTPTAEPTSEPVRVTYDASCHLCHGQGVVTPPLQILNLIPNIELVELPEADWCCGSAGIYSITQPEQAEKLLQRKLAHVRSTGATVVATGNPGCQLQLENGICENEDLSHCQVTHTMSLLAEAYSRKTKH